MMVSSHIVVYLVLIVVGQAVDIAMRRESLVRTHPGDTESSDTNPSDVKSSDTNANERGPVLRRESLVRRSVSQALQNEELEVATSSGSLVGKQLFTVSPGGAETHVYTHGPVEGPRHALEYFQHWTKGALAAALRNEKTLAALTHSGGTNWFLHCLGQHASGHATWELLQNVSGGDEDHAHHLVFRAAHGSRHQIDRTKDRHLQYVAVRSDRVLIADPPICIPAAEEAREAIILTDQGTTEDPTEDPKFGKTDGDDMLDPVNDTMVKDCVALFHRTARELCGKVFEIKVLRATLRIIDGWAVDLSVTVTSKKHGPTHHSPECRFEIHGGKQNPEPQADQLDEERQGMSATLVMKTALCLADQENGVSDEEAETNSLQMLYGMGELSFYKGYEHINDGIPEMELLDQASPEEEDWRSKYPDCFPDEAKAVVRNQANCGSCWAFAGASSVMNAICVSANGETALESPGDRYEVSTQQLMSCNSYKYGCSGGSASTVHKVLRDVGITKERDSPYQC